MNHWHTHHETPAPASSVLVAYKDGDIDGSHIYLASGLYLVRDGVLTREDSGLPLPDREYWWAYERDVLRGLR